MGEITYKVRNIDLAGPWRILNGSMFRPAVNVDLTEVEFPRSHGSVVAGSRYPSAILSLEHLVERSSIATVDQGVSDLLALLVTAREVERVVGGVSTYADAVFSGASEPTLYPKANAAKFTSQFRLPGVFWRQASTVTVGVPGSAREITGLAGSTAPINDAVIRFDGAESTGFSITDDANGTGFTTVGGAASGEHRYVDLATFQTWLSTSESAWTPGTSAAGYVDEHPAGMLLMQPYMQGVDHTDRRVTVTVSGGTGFAIFAGKAYL